MVVMAVALSVFFYILVAYSDKEVSESEQTESVRR